MLTRLGKPPVAVDAVDLLLECHERIRAFLAMGRRVAEAPSTDAAALADAAGRVRRYFTEALPLHARDEEDSILPRLRGRDARVDVELDAMAREHGEHEAALATLTAACGEVARDPRRHAELAPVIGAATADLERQFVAHLRREEEVVFPAMRRLLDRAEDAAIVGELRARRAGRGGQAA